MTGKPLTSSGTRKRKALFWGVAGRFIKRLSTFLVSIFLARLLLPTDFGLIAIVSAILSWSDIFLDFGFGQALVQMKKVSSVQLNTVFYINCFMALLIYFVLYASSPFIADFFGLQDIELLIMLLALSLFPNALRNVQASLMVKKLQFGKLTFIESTSNLTSGVLSILAALCGWGIWSLVVQQLFASIIKFFLTWFSSSWRPKCEFSVKKFSPILKYSYPLFAIGVLDSLVMRIDTFYIGKIMSPGLLGIYNRGKSIAELANTSLLLPITRTLFPIMSLEQEKEKKLKKQFFQLLGLLFFVFFPIQAVFFLVAEELILFVYTSKWLSSLIYLKFFVLLTPVFPLSFLSNTLYKAVGRTKLVFLKSLIERGVIICSIFIGLRFGFNNFLLSLFVLYYCFFVFVIILNKLKLGLSISRQVRPFAVFFLLTSVLVTMLFAVKTHILIVDLFVGPCLLFALFVLACRLFHFPEYSYFINEIRSLKVFEKLKFNR
ncbi:MAG: hypothetical protein CSA81_04685 [Acidobacteria bacterium]|nr:MAG: hypothetical protein CSA81_04685 [Acidobacteriota bacterium]